MTFALISLLVFIAAGASGAMLAGFVQLARRDLKLWRGRAVTVRALVIGYQQLPDGDAPIYAFTAPDGRDVTIVASGGRPPPGAHRRLVYLPGREHQAEPVRFGLRLALYPLLLAGVVASAGLAVWLVAG